MLGLLQHFWALVPTVLSVVWLVATHSVWVWRENPYAAHTRTQFYTSAVVISLLPVVLVWGLVLYGRWTA
jgi:hypothetical protein